MTIRSGSTDSAPSGSSMLSAGAGSIGSVGAAGGGASAAMPSILTGLRLSFALSFFVIVAAEFIAAERGLGFLINDAREFFRVDRMLLGAAAIGLLGYVFSQLFGRLERALLPWKG